ncbi:MAG: LytTR family DNA-binding domain-containing protein, partial [Bacteroidota bacterium]
AEMLQELIETQSDFLVVRSTDSIEGAVAYLKKHQHKLDLIFLDIQLADGESFEIFNEIEVNVPVIFCTAYDEYMLKAFKHNGIDYILKPFKEQDIREALEKFERLKSSLNRNATTGQTAIREFAQARQQNQRAFLVQIREKMVPVPPSEIAIIVHAEGITYLYNHRGEKFPIFKKMEEMEAALDTLQFFRINRQMLVNRDAIREIEPFFNRKVIVTFDFELPRKAVVSRLKVSPFKAWLEGH